MATTRLTEKGVLAAHASAGARVEIWGPVTPGLCLRVTANGKKVFVYRYRTEDGRQPRMRCSVPNHAATHLVHARQDAHAILDRLLAGVRPGNHLVRIVR
jgi:hypothetical protein